MSIPISAIKSEEPDASYNGEQTNGISVLNMQKGRSNLWNFFTKWDNNFAVCNFCQNKFSYKTSTANLKKHLNRKHNAMMGQFCPPFTEEGNQSGNDKLSSSDEKNSEIQESSMDFQENVLEPNIIKTESLTTDNLTFVDEYAGEEGIEQSKEIENEKVRNVAVEKAQNHTESPETCQSSSAIRHKTTNSDRRKKKKWSWIWNYFTEIDKNFALCKICNQVFNYKATTSNLAKHKTRMHPDVSYHQKETQETEKNESGNKEESREIGLVAERLPNIGEIRCGRKSAYERSSYVWRFFKKVNDTLAECNFCKMKLSYKNSVTNLMIHRKREHPAIHVQTSSVTKRGNIQNEVNGISANEDPSDEDLNDENCTENGAKQKGSEKKSSSPWEYFTMLDKHFVKCKICEERFSLKSTVSNLIRHIRRKHSSTAVQGNVKKGLVAVSLHGHIGDQTKISDSEEESPDEVVADTSKKTCRRTSVVWDFFTFIDKNYAQCKICKIIFSHRSTLTNLRKHYKRIHHIEVLRRHPVNQMQTEREEFYNSPVNEDYSSPTPLDQPNISESDGGPCYITEESEIEGVTEKSQIVEKYYPSWEFFNFIDSSEVQCKVCGLIFARLSTLLNLHQHFKEKHPDLTREFNSKAQQSPIKIAKVFHSFDQHQASDMLDEQPECVLPDVHDSEDESMPLSLPSTHASKNNDESHMPNTFHIDSQNRNTNILNERLVNAVEESNHLLKNMQKTMEMQGKIFNKLVTCLEGMKHTK